MEDGLKAGEIGLEHGLALLGVALTAVALGLLPVAVGLTILLGRTVPPEFGAGAGLAIVAGIKFGSLAWGMVAAVRAPRTANPASGFEF